MLLLLVLTVGHAEEPKADGSEAIDAYMDERIVVIRQPVSTVYAKTYDGSGTFWFVQQHGYNLGWWNTPLGHR